MGKERVSAKGSARRKTASRRDRSGDHGCKDRDRGTTGKPAKAQREGQKWPSRRKGTSAETLAPAKISHRQNGGYGKVGKMSAVRTKQEEVDRNFAFFESELPKLLPQHAGKFALIRDRQIINFYDTIRDAHTTGTKMYSDGLFSIQQVTNEAVDLGAFSHAMHLGTAQR